MAASWRPDELHYLFDPVQQYPDLLPLGPYFPLPVEAFRDPAVPRCRFGCYPDPRLQPHLAGKHLN